MKYLAIEFSNKYSNQFRDILDIQNNILMMSRLEYHNTHLSDLYNEYPLWIIQLNGILNDELQVYIANSIDDTIEYINNNKPEYIFFSMMEVTATAILTISSYCFNTFKNQMQIIIGGSSISNITTYPNINIVDSIDEVNRRFNLGREYSPIIPTYNYSSWNIYRLYFTKGCYNTCNFCLSDKNVTRIDKDIICGFINHYREKDIGWFYIGDLTFGQDYDWETSMLKLLNKYSVIQTSPNTVIKMVTNFKELYDLKVRYAELGIETFNDDTLKSLNKPFDISKAIKSIEYLNDVNIKVIVNLMINIKGETQTHFNNTLAHLDKLRDKIHHLNIAYYTDYNSKIASDRSEINLIKSWNTTPSNREKVWNFAKEIYKLNYELLTR